MSDANLVNSLQSVLAQYAGNSGGAPAAAAPGTTTPAGVASWLTPPGAQPAPPPQMGWSVPVEIPSQGPRGYGKVTVHLAFPAETWNEAPQIIQGLMQQGFEIRVFVPKPYNNNGGGYQNQGGGYNQGGGFNRGGGNNGGRY